MTNKILKSSFHEKLKMLLIAIGLMVTSLTTPLRAYDPHFSINGDVIKTWETANYWYNNKTTFQVRGQATSQANDEWGAYMWMNNGDYFGLNNGSNRYSSTTDGTEISGSVGAATYGYNGDKKFKYVGASGLVRVNVAESSNREWYPYIWLTESLETEILQGTKIMFYIGEPTSWGQHYFYLRTTNTTANTEATKYGRINKTVDSKYFAAVYADPSTRYFVGHSGWAGSQMAANAEAGASYLQNNSITKTEGVLPLFNTTSNTITQGTANSGLTATASNSVIGNKQNIYYYYTTSSSPTSASFTKFDPTDVSSLATGTYYVYALAFDGYICVRSSSAATLTINAAATATLTYHENFRTDGTNGTGSAPSAEVYAIGATATVAGQNTMAWTLYTFSGWNTDEHITGDHYDEDDEFEITEDMDLYATWTREILMDDQGATTPVSTTVYGTYNSTALTEHTNPAKTGYTFGGWYTQPAGSNNYVISPEHVLQASKTNWTDASGRFIRPSTSFSSLYAKWTQTVTLNANTDHHGSGANKTATATWNKGTVSINTHCTPATGYHRVGYYTDATGGTKVLNADGSFASSAVTDYITDGKWTKAGATTLYAHYEANTYTIAFDPNDANYVGEATGTTASIAATYDVSYTLTTNGYSREGYTFAGWSQNADGTGEQYTDGQTGVSNLTSTNGGTVTLYAKWTGKTYTVSFNAGTHGTCATASKDVTFGSAYGTLPTPTPSAGYVFSGWYTSASGGSQVTTETIVESAVDHTLYAQYAQKTRVYFMNTLNWSDVWVTYDAYWDKDHNPSWGTGNNGKIYHHMTQITGTNIWYDDIPDAVLASWKYFIAFNSQQLGCSVPDECLASNYNNFDKGKAVFRHDFDSYATLFVPQASGSPFVNNGTTYQSTNWTEDKDNQDKVINYRHTFGYWMRYGDTKAGYTIKGSWDSWNNDSYFSAATAGGTRFQVTKTLAANTTYQFLLYKHCTTSNTYNSVFTNIGATMTSSACTRWEFKTDQAYRSGDDKNAKIKTTVAGEYTFILECDNDGYIRLSVIYPFAVNDYRVLYSWDDGSAHTYESEIIHPAASTNETISVFVHKASNVTSQSLKLQKCTAINGSGVATWSDVSGGGITLPSDKITENGVYDFIITQPASGTPTGAYWNRYTGNYYIRTANSDGGWDQYKTCADNIMTLSEYSLTQTLSDPYSHYYCRFMGSVNVDVSYAVATDYSPNISGTMTGDATIGAGNKLLPATANVRFSWNEKTNALRRAYLKDAQGSGNARFLVLHGSDTKVLDANGNPISASGNLQANELLFSDLGNWVYQVELDAQPFAAVSLIANYNGQDRYLIGGADSYMQIMGGTGDDKYDILAVYDFKTNRLMTVWIPSDNITESLQDVDVLLIRHGQEAGRTIVFGTGGALNTNKVIGAIEFRYNELVGHVANWNQASREKLMFDVSFPFDVNVSDIFGLNAAYGEAYAVQKYNGEERAAKGFFQGDGTTTFWQTLSPSDVMKANVGYTIITDNDYFNNDVGHLWDNKSAGSKIYLYFPSASDVGNITSETQKITVPEHKCTIDRTFTGSNGRTMNHKYTDSNWNMMGVPVFANVTGNSSGSTYDPGRVFLTSGAPGEENTFHYFYKWNTASNGYDITAGHGYEFKSMHSYMVQYTGQVWFTGTAPVSAVAARRNVQEQNYTINMQLLDEAEEVVTRTYVELRENACDTFALNEDVFMIPGEGDASIYSFAGNYDVAANVLPIANQVVVLGVQVNKAGTYTFSMPSIFSGKVTLIDNFTGEHIDLSMGDYEVKLEKGIITDRFMLDINIEKVTTAIDGTNGKATLKDGKAHKFLQNGILYILQNGILYDAQGKRVQ